MSTKRARRMKPLATMIFKAAETPEQLVAIEKLANEIWHEHYTPIIGHQQVVYMLEKFQSAPAMQAQIEEGYQYFEVWQNKQLVGYLSFQLNNDELFLSKIYLHKSTRGMGFGRQMMAYVEQQAKNHQATKIRLTVNKYNKNSILAYHKLGFRTVEEVVADIGAGYVMDDYVLEKTLN